ncbi:carbohydrate kinase, YjeF related protein, partial [mine drainage metagenome]
MPLETLDSARIELNYFYRNGNLKLLKENAGNAVYEIVKDHYSSKLNILVICGSGNNGADGLIAANLLSSENQVNIIMIKPVEKIRS